MRRAPLQLAAAAALFAGALIASVRANGTSPIAWSDTFNDEHAVRRCIDGQGCTLTGIGTSIPDLFHAVGWLQLRSLLAWLGLDFDGVHLLLQILNALAVALLYHLATQLGGTLSGVAAVTLMVHIGSLAVQHAAIYNSTPLPFLGTAFLIACVAAIIRPSSLMFALAALVAAILANVHAACILSGASVVWLASIAPHRWRLAAMAGVIFACATFAIGPLGWLHDVARLFQHVGAGGEARALDAHAHALTFWSLFALAAWVVTYRRQGDDWVRMRKLMLAPLAVLLPMLTACLIAPRFGIEASAKYLSHVGPAAALAAALPLATLARALWARGRDGDRRGWLNLTVMESGLPFVLAVCMPFMVGAAEEHTPRTSDLAAAARLLQQRGWDRQHVIEALKTPQAMTVLTGVAQLVAANDERQGQSSHDHESALLLVVDRAALPPTVPPTWTILRTSSRVATLLIITHSRLDWSRFEVCAALNGEPAPRCRESGLRFVPDAVAFSADNMPIGGARGRGTLTLHVPLRAAFADAAEAIFMPRMPRVCGGVIASAAGELALDFERRRTTVSAITRSAVAFEWDVGSPACTDHDYDGLPPFVVAGDPDTVRSVEALLRSSGDRS